MDIGMFWYCEDKKLDIKQRLLRAVAYYKKKYLDVPDYIVMHPGMETVTIPGIQITRQIYILPNHFWIGKEKYSA